MLNFTTTTTLIDHCNALFLNIDNTGINTWIDHLQSVPSPMLSVQNPNIKTQLLFSNLFTGSKFFPAILFLSFIYNPNTLINSQFLHWNYYPLCHLIFKPISQAVPPLWNKLARTIVIINPGYISPSLHLLQLCFCGWGGIWSTSFTDIFKGRLNFDM